MEVAEKMIVEDLRGLLEKDIVDRVASVRVRQMVAEERGKETLDQPLTATSFDDKKEVAQEKRGLKGLSFRKRKQEALVQQPMASHDPDSETDEETPAVVTPETPSLEDVWRT